MARGWGFIPALRGKPKTTQSEGGSVGLNGVSIRSIGDIPLPPGERGISFIELLLLRFEMNSTIWEFML